MCVVPVLVQHKLQERKAWFQLPSTYTQEGLRVDNSKVATAEKQKKWKYLDKLKPVMRVDDNQE